MPIVAAREPPVTGIWKKDNHRLARKPVEKMHGKPRDFEREVAWFSCIVSVTQHRRGVPR
jgi:hypothetical protein